MAAGLIERKDKIQRRAHATGEGLAPHLEKNISNIVGDYLGFKGEHFSAGTQK